MSAAVALIVVLLEVMSAEPVSPVPLSVVSLDSLLRVEAKSMRSVENKYSTQFFNALHNCWMHEIEKPVTCTADETKWTKLWVGIASICRDPFLATA